MADIAFTGAMRRASDAIRDLKERTGFCDVNAMNEVQLFAIAISRAYKRASNRREQDRVIHLDGKGRRAIDQFKTRCKCVKRR